MSAFFPVTNAININGFGQYNKHHVYIEDDVTTWGTSGQQHLRDLRGAAALTGLAVTRSRAA